jgi:hypothetical protein
MKSVLYRSSEICLRAPTQKVINVSYKPVVEAAVVIFLIQQEASLIGESMENKCFVCCQ